MNLNTDASRKLSLNPDDTRPEEDTDLFEITADELETMDMDDLVKEIEVMKRTGSS
jgi:hypothetical protein